MGASKSCDHIAEKTLVEAAPGDFELRLDFTWQEDGARIDFRLTEQVVGIDMECHRHKL